jgi:hypothetical protein
MEWRATAIGKVKKSPSLGWEEQHHRLFGEVGTSRHCGAARLT